MPLALRFRRLTLALSLLSGSLFAETTPPDFISVVTEQFPQWDTNHDGTLSAAEIDAAIINSTIQGRNAAALAAIKRAERDPKLQLPPITLDYLKKTASAPAVTGQPNFPRMFKQGCDWLTADTVRDLFVGTPKLETIRQGKMGNCFSLAAVAAVVHRNPEDVTAMFTPEKDGHYRVKFGNKTVLVNGPTDAEIVLGSFNNNAGLWVNLYEKALATAINDAKPTEKQASLPLDAIAKGGSAGTILGFITGHTVEKISFAYAKDKNVNEATRNQRTDELRQVLRAVVNDHRAMTCGTSTNSSTTPGITLNHAYTILNYDAKTDMVELWNPHGDNFIPKGEAGATNGYPRKNGIFKMPVNDWIMQFSGMACEVAVKKS